RILCRPAREVLFFLFQRPRLIWDFPLGGIDHDAQARRRSVAAGVMFDVPIGGISGFAGSLQVGVTRGRSRRIVCFCGPFGRKKPEGSKESRLPHQTSHAFSRTIPNPFALGLTPSRRTPFIRPCGVDETTGTLMRFSKGTIRSNVLNAPQDTTSASALLEF